LLGKCHSAWNTNLCKQYSVKEKVNTPNKIVIIVLNKLILDHDYILKAIYAITIKGKKAT
jgi:hypothetical protein